MGKNLKNEQNIFPFINNLKNYICNSCCFVNNIQNSENSEKINFAKNLNKENLILFKHEKNLLQIKIKKKFIFILKNLENKKKFQTIKSFYKWLYFIKFNKQYENILGEQEKKSTKKYDSKIKENYKNLKKLEKEKIELNIKNESLTQSIEVNNLKIISSKEKEKFLNEKYNFLINHKKKALSDLQKNEADNDNKILSLKTIYNDLENKINFLKEEKIEKDLMLNSYVDEMNNALDYYEKILSKFFFVFKIKKFF